MQTAKCFLTIVALLVFPFIQAQARATRVLEMKTLMKEAEVVFVGQVKSVEPSGMMTELTYPSWENVVFEWLRVEVEVIESIKGTKKGERVRTLMLSTRDSGPLINAPGMVNPKAGQYYLLCLLPTDSAGSYAAVTAPFDDNQAIFLLNRKMWTDGAIYDREGKEVAFREQSEKNRALWDMINDKGQIERKAVERLRKTYAAEIATTPPREAIIYLKWKKLISSDGWHSNIPEVKSGSNGKEKGPYGPVTKP